MYPLEDLVRPYLIDSLMPTSQAPYDWLHWPHLEHMLWINKFSSRWFFFPGYFSIPQLRIRHSHHHPRHKFKGSIKNAPTKAVQCVCATDFGSERQHKNLGWKSIECEYLCSLVFIHKMPSEILMACIQCWLPHLDLTSGNLHKLLVHALPWRRPILLSTQDSSV